MKALVLNALTMVMLLLTTSVTAQEIADPKDPTGVSVLEKSWRKEVIDPMRDPNPLKPNEDLMRQTRAQKTFIKERDNAVPNQPTEPRMPASTSKPVTPERAIITRYVYRIKIKNNGEKRIKQLDWEYQFLDPDTQRVMEQRRITSRMNLAPGKSLVIERRLTRKPTVVVNADQLDRKYRDQFGERAVINRIVYTDGSVWQRPKS